MKRQFAVVGLVVALALSSFAWAAFKPLGEHYVSGGDGNIMRVRTTLTPTGKNGDYGTVAFPKPNTLYMVPVTVTQFDESNGANFALLGDGLITVMKPGYYTPLANIDWPANHGLDVGLRAIGIRRISVGETPPKYVPGQLTAIPPNSDYDSLGEKDLSGSDVPVYSRASQFWDPGTIQPGGFAYTDVALTNPIYKVVPGDTATAGHTGTSDPGLQVTAHVVGPNLVRVFIENRFSATPVTVTPGAVNVVGASTVASTGGSADGWMMLDGGLVYLYAGEKVMLVARTGTPGDYIQVSNLTFLQLTVQQ